MLPLARWLVVVSVAALVMLAAASSVLDDDIDIAEAHLSVGADLTDFATGDVAHSSTQEASPLGPLVEPEPESEHSGGDTAPQVIDVSSDTVDTGTVQLQINDDNQQIEQQQQQQQEPEPEPEPEIAPLSPLYDDETTDELPPEPSPLFQSVIPLTNERFCSMVNGQKLALPRSVDDLAGRKVPRTFTKPVWLIEFYTQWCKHCKAFYDTFQTITAHLGAEEVSTNRSTSNA
jgi:hypothetical protein